KQEPLTAVDDVSFEIHEGETLAIVGESGSGKSVTALSIMGLIPPTQGRITQGSILFKGKEMTKLSKKEMTRIRGNRISMIFQEPMTSLNPVLTAGFQLLEVICKHRNMDKGQALEEAVHMLSLVGIPEPESRMDAYPHQMSGGMRQRIMIAMALACHPEIMIADEPTTALDVTIQAQILHLINRLKKEIGMSVLLITHDLGVVAQTAQRVLVMYAGKIVESASVSELFARPAHPYTIGLFDSRPRIGVRTRRLNPIPGMVPALDNLPPGCAFQDRCSQVKSICKTHPPWKDISSGHFSRCWRHSENPQLGTKK
ncbi:MAG: ABC transporter ATP-binding protein, partial [Proteobacteria bacterium]|nr:ABC transporter ATP-binding protein [Pseudomonadota bacterium]